MALMYLIRCEVDIYLREQLILPTIPCTFPIVKVHTSLDAMSWYNVVNVCKLKKKEKVRLNYIIEEF